MTQRLRKETAGPVLAANGTDEGSAIGYASAVLDPDTRQFGLWYMAHRDGRIRLAVSDDARRWSRRGFAMADPECGYDNLGFETAGKRLDPWFGDAGLVGFGYRHRGPAPGLYALKCSDGAHVEAKTPGIIAGAGDRSSLFYDQATDEYWLISRRGALGLPGAPSGTYVRPRRANLWKSSDFVNWRDCGIILSFDDCDAPDVQIYGMQPFRWGGGFLAFVEIYHEQIERLDTQLAYSADGLSWRRTDDRAAVLPTGGEGAWDSHWTVPTFNSPIPCGDRVLVPYVGAGTKHGSKDRHRRGIGLASIRADGWVSLEAGRAEGWLVTKPLPSVKPMNLEVNADLHSGYLAVEVFSALPGCDLEPLPGYESERSRIEHRDESRHRINWGDQTAVTPVAGGRCLLRMTLYQGSLFSYRWVEAV
ncbi:MAG: hypothetical protein QGH74_08485 [Candidatus Brocadiia bacterium]|nr:hypothetical protein [Candidatus Brocadiia bacterium]